MTNISRHTHAPAHNRAPAHDRLTTIRRLYFYLVFLASLIAGVTALDQLLRVLSEAWLAPGVDVGSDWWVRETIASSAGVLVVATPIFLLHWAYIQRRLDSAQERQAALRKFALYAASAFTLGYALYSAYDLLRGVAYLAFGGLPAGTDILPSEWLHLTLTAGVTLGLLTYVHHTLVHDGDYGSEIGVAGIWRRLYQAAVGLAGLLLVIFGASQILQVGLQALVDQVAQLNVVGMNLWRNQLSDGLTALLLGAILVRVNWLRWQAILGQDPDEGSTGLRRFYLYAAVVISALTALTPSALLLRRLLLLLLGSDTGSLATMLNDLTTPLAFIPVGIAAWFWFRRALRKEANRYGESAESTAIRRLYAYLVSATALGLTWFGAVEILGAVIDWQLGPASVGDGGRIWLEPLATGLSLLIVGAPVWAIHWGSVQAVARQPDEAGAEERGAGARRAYLYGTALVSALFVLYFLAQVIYRLFLWLLGDPTVGGFGAETANDVARSLVAAIVWGYHVWAIRMDGQLPTASVAPVSDTIDERAALLARVEQLERELTAARDALADLDQRTPTPHT